MGDRVLACRATASSLFTQHPTRVAALPADLRRDPDQFDKPTLYLHDVPSAVVDEMWARFLTALATLRAAGKLGMCVEFRHQSWMTERNRQEILDFLTEHHLPLVCVDMPQGYRSSMPPVLAATADLAVVRFHGHSAKWTSKDIHERFGYLYRLDELREWAPRISELSGDVGQVQVLLNNCYRDYAQVNAQQLAELLNS